MKGKIKKLWIFVVVLMVIVQSVLLIKPFVKADSTNSNIIECFVKIQGLNGDEISGKATGSNSLEMVKNMLDEKKIEYTLDEKGTFIRINDLSADGNNGWKYYVLNNNKEIKLETSLEAYVPKGLDEIVVYYGDLTKEDKPQNIPEKPVEVKEPSQCLVRVEGLTDTITFGKAQGVTAFEIVKKVLDNNKVLYNTDSNGFTEINGLNKNSAVYWNYYIKKSDKIISPDVKLDNYKPDNQDEIILFYSNGKTPYLTNITLLKEEGNLRLRFLYNDIIISKMLVTIDNTNYVTDDKGEILILGGLNQGTHNYKISGYNIGKLSSVIMDQGTIFIDVENTPVIGYRSPNLQNPIDIYGDIIKGANAIKDYSDSFSFMTLNKLQMNKNENYIKEGYNRIKVNGINSLSNGDVENLIIALTACGYNPNSFAGSNLPAVLYNRNIEYFSTDDLVMSLIIMNYANVSNNYKIDRKTLIERLLKNELDNGWGIGSKFDPYITGAALCALAPYYNMENVKVAVNKGIKGLSDNINDDGYVTGYYGISSGGNAMAISGLIALGVNPEGITILDDGTVVNFGKSKGTLIDGLLSFKGDLGMFKNTFNEVNSLSATELSIRALLSIYEYKRTGYPYNFFTSEIDASKLKVYKGEDGENPIEDKNNESESAKPSAEQVSGDKGSSKEDSKKEETIKKLESKTNINISIGGLILVIGLIGVASQAINLNRRE